MFVYNVKLCNYSPSFRGIHRLELSFLSLGFFLGFLVTKSGLIFKSPVATLDTRPNEGQADSTLACSFSDRATPAPFISLLKVSWAEAKLQNLGYGPQSSDITVAGSTVKDNMSIVRNLGSWEQSESEQANTLR